MRFPTEIFENFSLPRNFAFEIAPKSMPPEGAQLGNDPQRSATTVPSVGMLRPVKLSSILSGVSAEIFENFSLPRNFAFEIA